MLKQITTLYIATSCLMGTAALQGALSCKPRATSRTPVTHISGIAPGVGMVSLFLLSGEVPYGKPPKRERLLKQLQDAMRSTPVDVQNIVLEYVGLLQAERIAAALFDKYINRPATRGRSLICGLEYQRCIEQLIQGKKDHSTYGLLSEMVYSMDNLDTPSPFEYIIEQKSQGGSCSSCKNTLPGDVVSRKCDSIYHFSQTSLDVASNNRYESLTITELLKRVMAFPRIAQQQCTCKSSVAVLSHDIFIKTPQLLLLHFESRPPQDIVIPEFIETPDRASTSYQLHGALLEQHYHTVTAVNTLQVKSSDKNWYRAKTTHSGCANSMRHNSIDKSGNFVCYNEPDISYYMPSFATYSYPKFLLYKKVHHQNTTSSCIIS
jgi:hypothetical protein